MLYSQKLINFPKINQKYQEKTHQIIHNFQQNIPHCLNITNQQDDLDQIQQIAKKISQKFTNIIILGTGGSSLSGKTFNAIASDASHVNLRFFESIDPDTIHRNIKNLNLKESFFICISKSGKTIETICQTLIITNLLKNNNIQIKDHFLFITQDQDSPIMQIANKANCQIHHHPKNIGGRFSCFSVVGLLPAALKGLNIKEIRNSASNLLNQFFQSPQNHPITQSIIGQLQLFDQNISQNILMPYIDKLENFNYWYRQIWAESLGKNNFGTTPINSMGTIDQHSQLQLYLQGPQNKFYNFVTLENFTHNIKINPFDDIKTNFNNKNLNQILQIEQQTTIDSITNNSSPTRIFSLANLNEAVLGQLMMQVFLEIIIIANFHNIDPFDQPAVEMRKNAAQEILLKDAV